MTPWNRVSMEMHKVDAVFVGIGTSLLPFSWHGLTSTLTVSKWPVRRWFSHVPCVAATIKCAKAQAGEGQKPSLAQVMPRMVQSKRDIEDPEIVSHTTVL